MYLVVFISMKVSEVMPVLARRLFIYCRFHTMKFIASYYIAFLHLRLEGLINYSIFITKFEQSSVVRHLFSCTPFAPDLKCKSIRDEPFKDIPENQYAVRCRTPTSLLFRQLSQYLHTKKWFVKVVQQGDANLYNVSLYNFQRIIV